MFIKLFYFLLYTIFLAHCKVEIRDANVAVLSREEIAMVFYITVENSNFCPYEIKVNMIKCTEIFSDAEKDSSFMYAIGGYMGVLKPHCFKNLTLIYPNMYLHNRRGFCLILIKFKSPLETIIQKKVNISFDTYISKKFVQPIMRGYYNKAEVMMCESVDLDPLNRCNPVDCPQKYLGTRNFYHSDNRRCERVPTCLMNPNLDMPNVIYSPDTNKCRNMEKTVTKEDLQTIESGLKQKTQSEHIFSNMHINCHFGKFNNRTGNCDCRAGWTSAPMDRDQMPTAGLFTYHMCNVESADWYDTDSRKLKLICLIVGILAVILALFVILCAFLIQICYNCIRSFEQYTCSEPKKLKVKMPKSTRVKHHIKVHYPKVHTHRQCKRKKCNCGTETTHSTSSRRTHTDSHAHTDTPGTSRSTEVAHKTY